MNHLPRRTFLGLGIGLAASISPSLSSFAAAPAKTGGADDLKEELVKFKKHEINGQKAPDFTVKNTTEKKFKAKDWLEIEFELECKAPKAAPKTTKFLDELSVTFYAYLEPKDSSKRKILKAKVTYINVPVDEVTHCVVYLSPATILNLTGDRMADKALVRFAGAEAEYGGGVVGRWSSEGKSYWWTPEVLAKSAKAPPVEEGRLLPKHKTPFAPLWFDYYMEEKTEG
ncbi:MAG: hypothetical protein KA004_14195 [Verrucomicrobiales bacterium]|nr:hypothetical protein [Verrucomicrobiales bacterium]